MKSGVLIFCKVKFLRLNIIFKEKTENIKTVIFYKVNLFFYRNIFRNTLLLCLCFLFITALKKFLEGAQFFAATGDKNLAVTLKFFP